MSYLSPREISDELHCSRAVVYQWVDAGLLKAIKPGGIVRIDADDYRRFLHSRAAETSAVTAGNE